MFVSAGKEEAKPPAPAPAPTMSNDDFRAHMAPPPPPKVQKPKPPPTTATRPEWARHTKGVGFELMKKMGFTAGWVKTRPAFAHAEVTKRPDGVGLVGSESRVRGGGELPQNIALQKELGQKVAEDVPVKDASSARRLAGDGQDAGRHEGRRRRSRAGGAREQESGAITTAAARRHGREWPFGAGGTKGRLGFAGSRGATKRRGERVAGRAAQ